MPRHFLTLSDVPAADWPGIFRRARQLKADRLSRTHTPLLGKSVALVFEKASTRTRVSFEVGVFELGGHAIVLSTAGSQLARGEPIEDTARVLSGYCDGIMLRTFSQARVVALANASTVPVINGLTDEHHPCQLIADLLTVIERFPAPDSDLPPPSLRYAWIGDGNNMANSWIEAAGLFGLDLILACPEGYLPDPGVIAVARQRRARITLTTDPKEAAHGADVISTDVWASMGQEDEAQRRREAFAGFCVDQKLLATAKPGAIVLHCLPAHRGEEISGEVLDGPQSAAWQQAENRLHAQKALLEYLMT